MKHIETKLLIVAMWALAFIMLAKAAQMLFSWLN